MVRGRSVESCLIVASLNVNTSFLALKTPFSRGSGSFDSEIIPITPLISSTRLYETLSEAFLNIPDKFIFLRPGDPISVGEPQ